MAALPWHEVDGKLHPNGTEGAAALHHKDGWTALAFADRSIDDRGGSNSVFFLPGTFAFVAAVEEARRLFPWVMGRFTFEIRDVNAPSTSGVGNPMDESVRRAGEQRLP